MSSPDRPDVPTSIPDSLATSELPATTVSPETGSPSSATDPASAGVAAPDTNTTPPAARAKTKGVADIVFVVDVSGSMKPCIDALRVNIEAFIDSLGKGEGNNNPPVKDWRAKVVGFRDVEAA